MKMMKKLAALGLAIALALGMSLTAMAATITVEDTVKDATYTAYKIFDAVAGAGDAVSYKIPSGSTIESAKGFSDVFTTQNNGGDTYVWKKEGVADSAVVAFLETYLKNQTISGTEMKASGKDLKFSNLDAGYYYVKSTVNGGSVVMLGTAADAVTIYEKNSQAGWGDEGGKAASGETFYVGDTINYTLTYTNAVNYNQSTGGATEKVYQYVVKDTLPAGIELNTGSIVVTVNDKAITDHPYTSTQNGITKNGFEITIPWAATQSNANDFYYDAPAVIKVTYSAKMVSSVTAGADLKNTATINPNTKTNDPGKDKTVYTGQLTMNKVDGSDSTKKLSGAEFKIIDTATVTAETTKYLVQNSDGEFSWTTTAANGTTFTTDSQGSFVVKGLKAGDYWLLETKAPAGYNLMQTAQKFSIALDNKDTETNELLVTSTVQNNAGSQLPSTGGIGTTIFYVVGGILVAVAVVLLVTKKRMSNRA